MQKAPKNRPSLKKKEGRKVSNKSQLAKTSKSAEDRAKLAKFKKGLLSNSMTPKVIQTVARL